VSVAIARWRAWRPRVAIVVAHLLTVGWLFGGALFEGRLLFFRDLSLQYAPDFAVAARALRGGTWPLWNPLANGGEPFLLAYAVDIVLLLVGGWRAPLGVGAALHLLLALLGASWLASRLGMGPWGSWLTGAAYGLGGLFLSMVNLLQLFEAAAWAPWVLGAGVLAVRRTTGLRLAVLAVLAAVQLSTLGVEIVLQTALVGAVLVGGRALASRRKLAALALAAVVSGALAAPALVGAHAMLRGTARERGFPAREALAYSLHPVVLAEAVMPKLTGDPHTFSGAGFWGRRYFPDGYPYFLTLYVGVGVLVLAAHARARKGLVALALVGVAFSAGEHGPLGLLPGDWTLPVRGPQKLFFLTHVSLALLAGLGLERVLAFRPAGARRLLPVVPGALLLGAGGLAALAPEAASRLARTLVAIEPADLSAVAKLWATTWLPAGALAVGAGLALAGGRALRPAAGILAVLDLIAANGAVNVLAPAHFYDLREDVASLVKPASEKGRFRWYSYGVAHTPGLRFEPTMASAGSDVWLFYLDRQTLLSHTPALDGLASAFDLDRTGWSPPGSTLSVPEARPDEFRRVHGRLRLAGVRWVLSFAPLPDDLVAVAGEVKLPEVVPPLRIYEVQDALPRAFWLPGPAPEEGEGPLPPTSSKSPRPRVSYEPVDVHTVRVSATTPPGTLVILDGFHPGWEAENRSGTVPIQPALGRYRAIATPGGVQEFTLRYRPGWRPLALGLLLLGVLAASALCRVSTLTGPGTPRAILPREVTESVSQSDTTNGARRLDGF